MTSEEALTRQADEQCITDECAECGDILDNFVETGTLCVTCQEYSDNSNSLIQKIEAIEWPSIGFISSKFPGSRFIIYHNSHLEVRFEYDFPKPIKVSYVNEEFFLDVDGNEELCTDDAQLAVDYAHAWAVFLYGLEELKQKTA